MSTGRKEEPLDVRCGIKESRLPLVTEVSGVNEHFGIADDHSCATEKTIRNDVADEENYAADNQPALHRPNDPTSATAATRRADCNCDGPPPFAAAHG